jgi:spermidine/putrescine transport system permease protein
MKRLTHAMVMLCALLASAGGCRDEESAPSGGGGAGASGEAAAPKLSGELNILIWSEYIPKPVIRKFQDETGVRVKEKTFASNEEMLNLMQAGSYDIAQPSEYTVEYMVSRQMLMEIDHAKVPNLQHVLPIFKDRPFDPGNKYSVPFMAGTVGIVYDKKKIKEDIQGFGDIFQEKYRGRIVVLDDSREIVSWALRALGKDLNDMSDANLEAARPLLQKWLPLVAFYDSDSPKDKLRGGDVDIGVAWGGEGAILLAEDPDRWAWVLPKEGAHLFIDSLVIPKNARNVEAAHAFINFIQRPDIMVMVHEEYPYLNPNAKAREQLSEEQRSNVASFPPEEQLRTMEVFRSLPDETSKKIETLVSEVKGE